MIVNYYALPEVSSSDLGELERLFYNRPRPDLEQIFAFGSLVDAMLTEPALLLSMTYQMRDGNRLVDFDVATWRLAETLASNLRTDPIIARLLPFSRGQYIFRRTLEFAYEGEAYKIRSRCKFDLLARAFSMGLDFKTTSCTSQKQFEEAIAFFDWDKQGAYYMDIARIDRHWIAGVSKKTGKVFKYVIERGDETHKRGQEKYSIWAYRWITLIEPFEKQLLKIAS